MVLYTVLLPQHNSGVNFVILLDHMLHKKKLGPLVTVQDVYELSFPLKRHFPSKLLKK